jgi:RNA polymerase sigma-70 factor (ECF subfamily)
MEASAWERLSALYGPIVYGWCRRSGLQENDAADCTQEVFRSVFQNVGQFRGEENGGSFRGWLWAITRNQIREHFRLAQHRAQPIGGSDARHRLDQVPEANLPDEEPDAETTRRLMLWRALELVRGDFQETTWAIFEKTTLEHQSYEQVAETFGIKVNAVRQARFRVLRRLREELDGLF